MQMLTILQIIKECYSFAIFFYCFFQKEIVSEMSFMVLRIIILASTFQKSLFASYIFIAARIF